MSGEINFSDPYDLLIWFGPERVGPQELVTLRVILSRHFLGQKLVVPSPIGNSFSILNIVVNGEAQTATPNPVPAAAFSELARGVHLGLPTNLPGTSLDILAANITDEERIFVAFVEGTFWEGDPANKFRVMKVNGQDYKIDENPLHVSKTISRQKL